MDLRETITYLFERLPEDRQTFACIRGYGGDRGGAVHRFIACGGERSIGESIDEAVQAALDFTAQKLNVNLCIGLVDAPPEPGKGISAEMVTGLFAFFSDLDTQQEGHVNGAPYPPTLEDAKECLKGLEPPWLIDSGYGLHGVFLFEEPYFYENDIDKRKTEKIGFNLGQKLRQRAQRKGWKLDATHEVTRGFRLPGTVNFKGGVERVIKWNSRNELTLEPSEIEEYLESVRPYDEAAADLPPQSLGDQLWRTAAEYQGLTVVQGRRLSDDKLHEFWNDGVMYDGYHEPCKPKKRQGYNPSSRGDTSERDFKLAIGAVKQGFTNQEIADLLIGCRAHNKNDFKRRDYYLRTIWAAREKACIPTPEAAEDGGQQQQQRPQQPMDEQERQRLLDSISRVVRDHVAEIMTDDELAKRLKRARSIRIIRGNNTAVFYQIFMITKVRSDPHQYEFHISDGSKVVVEGGEQALFDEAVVRQAFYCENYSKPYHTPAEWRDILEQCRLALVPIPAIAGTTKQSELEGYVNEFCRKFRFVSKVEDSILVSQDAPLLKDGNQVWLPEMAFLNWARTNCGMKWTVYEFTKIIHAFGFKKDRLKKGKLRTPTMVRVPDGMVDIDEIVDTHNAVKREKRGKDEYVN